MYSYVSGICITTDVRINFMEPGSNMPSEIIFKDKHLYDIFKIYLQNATCRGDSILNTATAKFNDSANKATFETSFPYNEAAIEKFFLETDLEWKEGRKATGDKGYPCDDRCPRWVTIPEWVMKMLHDWRINHPNSILIKNPESLTLVWQQDQQEERQNPSLIGQLPSDLLPVISKYKPVEFKLLLMEKEIKPDMVKEGELYVGIDGSYISRFNGTIYRDSLPSFTVLSKYTLEKRLCNPDFKREVSTITSKRNHTLPPVCEPKVKMSDELPYDELLNKACTGYLTTDDLIPIKTIFFDTFSLPLHRISALVSMHDLCIALKKLNIDKNILENNIKLLKKEWAKMLVLAFEACTDDVAMQQKILHLASDSEFMKAREDKTYFGMIALNIDKKQVPFIEAVQKFREQEMELVVEQLESCMDFIKETFAFSQIQKMVNYNPVLALRTLDRLFLAWNKVTSEHHKKNVSLFKEEFLKIVDYCSENSDQQIWCQVREIAANSPSMKAGSVFGFGSALATQGVFSQKSATAENANSAEVNEVEREKCTIS